MSDEVLTERIRQVITTSSFAGEGHRKVRAHLRREHQLCVGKNRVLRLMRNAGLLAPQRAAKRRRPRVHDGRIITDAPNVRWGTDATMAWTRNDGWVWVFALLDHYTDEAWAHVAKVGNRFAALQPVYDVVIDRFGELGPDVARGIKLRHDWGSQYRAHHFVLSDIAGGAARAVTRDAAHPLAVRFGEPRLVAGTAHHSGPLRAGVDIVGRPGHRTQDPMADRLRNPLHGEVDVAAAQGAERMVVDDPLISRSS